MFKGLIYKGMWVRYLRGDFFNILRSQGIYTLVIKVLRGNFGLWIKVEGIWDYFLVGYDVSWLMN